MGLSGCMSIGYTGLDFLFCAVALDVFNIRYILSSTVGASRDSPVTLSLASA